MRAFLVAALVLPWFIAPAASNEACNIRLLRDSDAQYFVSSQGGMCQIQKLITPHYGCQLWYGQQHGWQGLLCGDLQGLWGVQGNSAPALGLTTIGTSRRIKLPRHATARKSWLAPLDTEGLHQTYPISMDDYIDYYPRIFTKVGSKSSPANPEIVVTRQTVEYTTMKGKRRVAITGSAQIGCQSLYFLTWTSPDKAKLTEKDMDTFLADLRLQPANLSVDKQKLACSSKY
ncbi:hypothetical protein FZC33_25640 [Labrys sp. KNU-23]|uniref:hypothetical protein n=1 Tax=Labrys sp. KNU-23 TaxID=2789216 RepID=UPI0011EED07C|nr:hypothetical protein [Labrys sp. KNU-23]QEN89487.1 hypothetical protein FZC33_25640 [Labrys sp. KNU-23]